MEVAPSPGRHCELTIANQWQCSQSRPDCWLISSPAQWPLNDKLSNWFCLPPPPAQSARLGSPGSFLSSLMCLATTKKCFKTTLLKSGASNDPTDIDQSHSPLHSTFTEYSLKIYNKWATEKSRAVAVGRAEIASISVRARNTCLYVGSISWQKVRRLFRVNFTGCELLNEDLRCPGPGQVVTDVTVWEVRGDTEGTQRQSPDSRGTIITAITHDIQVGAEFFLLFCSGGRKLSEIMQNSG